MILNFALKKLTADNVKESEQDGRSNVNKQQTAAWRAYFISK